MQYEDLYEYPIDTTKKTKMFDMEFELPDKRVGQIIMLNHYHMRTEFQKKYELGELKLEDVQHYHFKLVRNAYQQAEYILFASIDGRLKFLKQRKNIIVNNFPDSEK